MAEGQAQQAPPEMSAEVIAMIHAKATEHFMDFKANATDEQKATYWNMVASIQADPEHRNRFLGQLMKEWAESDLDGDGKLNIDEFRIFAAKRVETNRGYGCYLKDDWDDNYVSFFAMLNAISEGEGLVVSDFMRMLGVWAPKYKELNEQQ